MKKENLNQENQRVKEIYLNSEDSKIEVELEPVREIDEIMDEFKKTLKEDEFFDELKWVDYDSRLDYSEYKGRYTSVDFHYEEYGDTDCYLCNFDLDENQKKLLVEYLKAKSNELSTYIICEMNDDATDEETICTNSLYITDTVIKYEPYTGRKENFDKDEVFSYHYDVVRRMVDDEDDDEE